MRRLFLGALTALAGAAVFTTSLVCPARAASTRPAS